MKKVALVNPGKNQEAAVQEPLNLGFIAAYLEKNGIGVKIIDQLAGQDVKEELDKFLPDIVGITATTPFALDAYKIAKLAKDRGALTVIGGVHASVLPDEALQYVDIVVKGEGEQAMLDVVKNNFKQRVISRSYIRNLDDIPTPAYHLMQMDFYLATKDRLPGSYLHFVPPHTKVASILSSRGCPYSCTFCHNTWRGIPCRFNSAERVISDIKYLSDRYDIKDLFFIEDNFLSIKQG